MRTYIARQKETFAIMAFVTYSYKRPDDELLQMAAEMSLQVLLDDLMSELTLVLVIAAGGGAASPVGNAPLAASNLAGYKDRFSLTLQYKSSNVEI
jgi:hypothetical protein